MTHPRPRATTLATMAASLALAGLVIPGAALADDPLYDKAPAPAVAQPTPTETYQQLRTPPAPTGEPAQPGHAVSLGVRTQGALGPFLVDGQGRALYGFMADRQASAQKSPRSDCTGSCAEAWPPLTTSAAPQVSGGLDAAAAGAVPREDGSLQVTYNGIPLYTFAKDPTGTSGHGLPDHGGPWFLVTPEGGAVGGNATSPVR